MSTVDINHQPHGLHAQYGPYSVDEDIRGKRFNLDEYLFKEWDSVRSGTSLKQSVRRLVLSNILRLRSVFRDM